MSIALRIREGRRPHWALAKRLAKWVLQLHLPINLTTKPLFRVLYLGHVAGRELLIWSIRFFWYEPLFRSQCIAVGERFQMEALPYITGKGAIFIGDEVRLSGESTIGFSGRVCRNPEFRVGNGTFIGHGCGFSIARSVRIGSHCLIASGVRIYDFDAHSLVAEERRMGVPPSAGSAKPIEIGDSVWIGAGAIILKGVTIGDRSIVGAAAVVTASVPADTVVAGNPARPVKTLCTINHEPIGQ